MSNLEESCGSVARRLKEAEAAMAQFTDRATELNQKRSLNPTPHPVHLERTREKQEGEIKALVESPSPRALSL